MEQRKTNQKKSEQENKSTTFSSHKKRCRNRGLKEPQTQTARRRILRRTIIFHLLINT